MANSDVEICNMALDDLGTGNIISFDEQYNDNAKLCKRWYEVTRKSLLKDLNASFAIKRDVLAALSSTPAYGRTYEFLLPNDCLKLLNINGPLDEQDYQIEGNKILYDSDDPLYIRYVSDFKEVNKFDDEFKECLAIYIATNICMKVRQDTQLLVNLQELKRRKYNDTAYKYAKDNPPKKVSHSRFMASKDNLTYENENYFRGSIY